ncbi:hypothetical protein [Candidatus Leptofilum sp.]|uniref:hypothetical protein n=1 Tax=Candidatus Leptofilum sp. TaxID=3241576 RepID=UPI003B5928C8
MVLKPIRFGLLLSIILLSAAIVGCSTEEEAEINLPEVACTPGDVNADPPFVVAETRTAVPPETFLADQIENYYGVELIENRLTNTAAFCDLFEMADEEAAIEMLTRTCTVPQMEEAEPPTVGQEVCALQNTGFRMVNFRQGRVVVSILADLGGFGVDEWAVAVNGRLQGSN